MLEKERQADDEALDRLDEAHQEHVVAVAGCAGLGLQYTNCASNCLTETVLSHLVLARRD
eukprot:COSAG01_NODE_1075_length_11852_cov_4.249128_13_plen_60_part_00